MAYNCPFGITDTFPCKETQCHAYKCDNQSNCFFNIIQKPDYSLKDIAYVLEIKNPSKVLQQQVESAKSWVHFYKVLDALQKPVTYCRRCGHYNCTSKCSSRTKLLSKLDLDIQKWQVWVLIKHRKLLKPYKVKTFFKSNLYIKYEKKH